MRFKFQRGIQYGLKALEIPSAIVSSSMIYVADLNICVCRILPRDRDARVSDFSNTKLTKNLRAASNCQRKDSDKID